jgi:HTH-type transcriptional regulator / antitoxin HigA
MIEVIKTDAQYREVLARIGQLVEFDPSPDSDEGRELEVLALLIRDYERRSFPLAAPSPLAAIRLKMDQRGLSAKDLVPYLGSKSRVSEVLSGKRQLSLAMIRALNSGLAIPLESLVSEQTDDASPDTIEWDRFPIKEMIRRKWFEAGATPSRPISFDSAREIMESFLRPVGGPGLVQFVLQKKDRVRTGRTSDRFALTAWAARVIRVSSQVKPKYPFSSHDWDAERYQELRSLSRYDVGPRLAIQFLAERGIVVVVEPHLPRTRLDGAAMIRSDGVPIIALTIRHDRLDNFWFTLFHELIHVIHHLQIARDFAATSAFFDDLDVPDDSPIEHEADDRAREALISDNEWQKSAVRFVVAPATVSQLASEVGVADAVVAGRVRHERRNYRLLASMVGNGLVRKQFPEVAWPDDR